MIAIMAIDPGRVTGVARGIFGPGMEAGLGDALGEAVDLETWEVEGLHAVQAWELASEFHDWVHGLVADRVVEVGSVGDEVCLAVEDFRLRTQNVDLDPVLVLGGLLTLMVPRAAGTRGVLGVGSDSGGGLEGTYALGAQVVFQQPADAMRFATNDRLKWWGVGDGDLAGLFGKPISEHRRDAFRHLCLRLGVAMHGLVGTGGAAGGAGGAGRPGGAAPLGSTANAVVRGPGRAWGKGGRR